MGSSREDRDLRTRDDCRYCGSTDLRSVLDLGAQPPSNSFIRPDAVATERRYPLEMFVCGSCWLSQLRHVVPGAEIFDDYLYLSSTSKALVRHYGDLVRTLAVDRTLRPGDVVVDIGCNDGVLLGQHDPALVRVGVEPSRVAEHARAAGLVVMQEFFGEETARRIVREHGRARVVTATNVFAHVDDITAFARSLPSVLADDGIFVLEVSYLPDLIDGCLFDTIYHEHLCYCSLTPMVPFLERCGLEVVDASRVPFGASGPAIRVTAQLPGAGQPAARVRELLAYEEAWGISRMSTYTAFAERVRAVRSELRAMLESLRRGGARIAAFGAPAKGNTLLNYIGADPDLIEFVAENNPIKQGTLTPGTHIPVTSDEHLLETMPPYALLLAWNYADFFLANSDYIKRGGRFVMPLPVPRILPAVG